MPTTSGYSAKENEIIGLKHSECPEKGKQLSQTWMRSICQLQLRHWMLEVQGAINSLYFWKCLFLELHMGQIVESNVERKIAFGRWVFRNPLSLLCTLIKEIFLVKKKWGLKSPKRRKVVLDNGGPYPGCLSLKWKLSCRPVLEKNTTVRLRKECARVVLSKWDIWRCGRHTVFYHKKRKKKKKEYV